MRAMPLWAARILSILAVLVVAAGIVTATPRGAVAGPGEIPEQRTGSSARGDRADRITPPKHNAPPAEGLPEDQPRPQTSFDKPSGSPAQFKRGAQSAPAKGFDPKTSKEIPGKGAPERQVFANADGTETTRFFSGRQMFRGRDGQWSKVDSTLVADETQGSGWRVAADSLQKRFASTANAERLATVELAEGKSVAFGVAGAAAVRGKASGDSVVYPSVRPDADLRLQATAAGVKELIVLRSADAPAVWDFPLELSGLTAVLANSGGVELRDAAGAVVGYIPPGYMEDSNIDPRSGDGSRSEDVRYELLGSPGSQVLRLSADHAWLADPSRKFPVLVDPTVTRISSHGSSYVMYPYTNDYSGESELKVGTYNSGSNKAAALLKFSMSDINKHHILDAKLNLYSIWSYSCSSRDLYIRPLSEFWTTSGNKSWPGPSYGSEIVRKSFAYGYSSSCGPRWVPLDVTSQIHKWTHGTANYGLRLSASGSDSYGWKKFASSNTANAPYLDVTHNSYWAEYPEVTPTKAVQVDEDGAMKVTVKNLGAETWTPTNAYKLAYRIWNTSTNQELSYPDYIVRTKMPTTVAFGQSVTMTAPVKKLPPGSYRMFWDMVKEGVTRFSVTGAPKSQEFTFTVSNSAPYVTNPVSPPSGFQSDTLTPTLTITGKDPDNYPGTGLKYRFKVCKISPWTCFFSPWQSSSSWTIPAGQLSWGVDYAWYGQVDDGENIGGFSAAIYLTTRVAQPAITSHLGGKAGGGADPAVGNFTAEATDASISAVGPTLAVERTYNSQDPRRGNTFGAGWSTDWDTKLVPDNDGSGNVVITFPDGRQARYGKNPDGSFATPSGQRGTLVSTSSGWTLRDVGDVRYVFDSSGKLVKITDAAGHAQLLTYNGVGQLDQATDETSGRYLAFTWAGAHVTQVTTGPTPALTWTYTYDGDRLTKVCDPEQACTGYGYTSTSQYRTAGLDSNPKGYWRLAEASGTTAASEVPGIWGPADGTSANLLHGQAGPIAGSTATASGFNGTSSVVKLPNGLIDGRGHLGIEMWFKTTNPGALFGYQNVEIGTTTPTSHVPALYVGSDGKLRGEFFNGSLTPIASDAAVTDGQWHHVVLTATGDKQTLYLDGAVAGSRTGQIVATGSPTIYNQVGAAFMKGRPAQPVPDGTVSYFDGQIAEVAVHHRPLSAATVAEHFAARAAADKLVSVTPPGRTVASNTVTFDPKTERVTEYADANGGTWKISVPTTVKTGEGEDARWETKVVVTDPANANATYVYDPTRGGRVTSVADGAGATTTYDYDVGGFPYRITDPLGHTTELRHDARGNEISRTQCRTAGTTACYTSYRSYFINTVDPLDPRNDQVIEYRDARSASGSDATYLTTYAYHPNGELESVSTPGSADGTKRTTTHAYTDGTEAAVGGGTQPAWLLKSVTNPGSGVTKYDYTSAGDLARETDPEGLVTEYSYDGIGRKNAETTLVASVPGGSRTTFVYDGTGRVTTELQPESTNTVTGTAYQQRTVHIYNPDGTVASTTVSDAKGNAPARATSYGYDALGRQTSVTDPEGGVTSVAYDAFGDVVSRTDAAGTRYSYTYTPGKRQLATTTVHGFTGDGGDPRDVVFESRTYDLAGRVLSSTDGLNFTTEYTYFDDGLIATESLVNYSDPATNEVRSVVLASYDYTGNGEVSRLVKGNGQFETRTSYDPGGRPAKNEDYEGDTLLRSTDTTFDGLDNPTEIIDRHADGSIASQTTLTYDKVGRELSRTDQLTGTTSATTTTVRDERGLPTKVIDPRGNASGGTPENLTTEFTYDALGQQISVKAPPVEVESGGQPAATVNPVSKTGYNAFGEVTHSEDANGKPTVMAYDKAGRPVSTTLPSYTRPGASAPTTATYRTDYDPAGRVAASYDGAGNKTEYGYDELGNVRRKTDPPALSGQVGDTTIASHTVTGLRTMVADPNGAQTYATYDGLGRQITKTVVEREPAPERNLTTRYTHDVLGNPATVTTPGGQITSFEHDDLGNPTKMTDPAGVVTTAVFDSQGRTLRVDDPKTAITKFSYDLAGRNTSIREENAAGAELRVRSFGYDIAGNQTLSTDAMGGEAKYVYDALGRLTRTTQQVSDTKTIATTFGYDKAGNLTRATDGNGNTTVFTFNSWNLQESAIEPSTAQTTAAADRTYTSAYDANGRVSSLTKPGGVTITNTFDPLGNLIKQTGSGANRATPDRTFSYDKAGRLTAVSAPGGDNTYTYDDRGLLHTATGPSGATTFTWNDDGKLTSAQTGAGTADFGYDAAGRLTSASDPLTQATASYTYDTAGRVKSIAYGSASRSYAYDELGRLDTDTVASGSTVTAKSDYGYDKADRLTSKSTTGVAGAASNSYGYDKAGRLTSWNDGSNTTAYGWDDAGNLVSRGGVTATYNERNQLLSHGSTSYAYTPRGTMSSRKDGLLATAIEYNAFDQLVADGATGYEYDGLKRLVKAGDKPLAYVGTSIDVASDGTRRFTYTPDGMLFGVGGVAGSPLNPGEPAGLGWTDQHTDVVGVVDPSTGQLSGSRTFDPFGTVVAASGIKPGLGYQHQYTDPGTGNVNMGARWYQPSTGTFASRDNAVLDPRDIGNSNRYAYAGGNPLTQTDPEGYFWGKIWNGVKKVGRAVVNVVKEVSGYNDLKGCFGGSWSSCGWFVAGLTPFGKIAKGIKYGAKALGRFGKGSRVSGSVGRVASKARSVGGRYKAVYSRGAAKLGKVGHVASYYGRGAIRSAARGGAKAFGSGGGAVFRSAEAAAAAARAAAEAARLAARRAMVHNRAVTPAAKPPKSPSISPSVQAKLDAANNQPAMDLGDWGVGDDVVGAGGRAADEFVPTPMEPSYMGPSGGGMPGMPLAPKLLPSSPREPPNAPGSTILSRLLAPGEEFNMVLSKGQPASKPGGFGTFDDVPDQAFARDSLAIRTDWKSDVSLVQRYRAPSDGPRIRVQESIVGPQQDPVLGYLGGGANQLEILNFADRARLLPIGKQRELK